MPMTESQVQELTALLENDGPESGFLLELLMQREEPGVGTAAKVKAA